MEYLKSQIGKSVHFGVPKNLRGVSTAKKGRIIDEIWADPKINKSPHRKAKDKNDWGDYSFCAQLIEWDGNQKKEYSIRFAYFRRAAGKKNVKWRFASQTTVNSNYRIIKKLLERTLLKKEWFRKIPKLS